MGCAIFSSIFKRFLNVHVGAGWSLFDRVLQSVATSASDSFRKQEAPTEKPKNLSQALSEIFSRLAQIWVLTREISLDVPFV